MSDLVSRFTATLDELERRALACTPGPWRWGNWQTTFGTEEPDRRTLEHAPQRGAFPAVVQQEDESRMVLPSLEDSLEIGGNGDEPLEENAAHIIRWDPQAVLRLAAAAREVIAEYLRVRKLWSDALDRGDDGQDETVAHRYWSMRTLAAGFGVTEEDTDGQ